MPLACALAIWESEALLAAMVLLELAFLTVWEDMEEAGALPDAGFAAGAAGAGLEAAGALAGAGLELAAGALAEPAMADFLDFLLLVEDVLVALSVAGGGVPEFAAPGLAAGALAGAGLEVAAGALAESVMADFLERLLLLEDVLVALSVAGGGVPEFAAAAVESSVLAALLFLPLRDFVEAVVEVLASVVEASLAAAVGDFFFLLDLLVVVEL